jgi:hypothetical protein
LAAAGKKIQLLEDEIDEIRAKHRSTPEVALMQQLAEAKGQLADSERRIEMIKAEKSEVMLEKEHFRASVNKLVGGSLTVLCKHHAYTNNIESSLNQ